MKDFSTEIFFKTARSGGSGGQNVNKVETMVEANWLVAESSLFLPEEKQLICEKLKNRINKDGNLIVKCSETRSQLENKHRALEKILDLVNSSLIIQKKRRPTKPSKATIEKRLMSKKKDSYKKDMRKPPLEVE